MKRLLLSLAVGVLAVPVSAQAVTRAPTPGTQAASLITTSSAVLNGYVNPNGAATTGWFQWGLSNKSLTNSTTAQAAGAGTTPVTLSASLTGLTPNTTYRFRMAGANTRGTRYGSTLSFKTPAVPLAPTVVTGSASGISQTGATLKGTVNPNGGSVTDCHFDWGISTTYGQIAPCGQAPGAGTTAVPVSATLSGLTASASYHFRVVATNATGTNTGTDGTFTTLAAAPPKSIYLTFDDGPAGGASGYTAQVLSDLEAGGAKASFFETGAPSPDYYTTTGMALGANQPLIARERADGDQIGTHTWDHPDMTTLSCADQQTEIAKARTLQVQLTGGYQLGAVQVSVFPQYSLRRCVSRQSRDGGHGCGRGPERLGRYQERHADRQQRLA